jgi:molybdenum cofactor synthesis domain-containing protein
MLTQPRPTAGIIIIGNEILSGQTTDKNLSFIAQRLGEKGVMVPEAIVIPDDRKRIIQMVRDYSERFTYVFTTGGIGPTHDDITASCVAEAFGEAYVLRQDALDLYKDRYAPEDLNDARKRMAMMPETAHLIINPVSQAPGFYIRNVYVLAGIPSVMQGMMQHVAELLEKHPPRITAVVKTVVTEGRIAKDLSQIQETFPHIEIGSYPHWNNGPDDHLKLVLKGDDPQHVRQATELVIKACAVHDPEVAEVQASA